MDKLEKFIKENRNQFDGIQDRPNWDELKKRLDTEQNKPNYKGWYWVAASIAILMIVSIGSYQIALNNAVQRDGAQAETPVQVVKPEQTNQSSSIQLGDISEKYADIENHYAVLVDNRKQELSAYNPDPELMSEVHMLEQEYERLKLEIGNGGNDEQVIEAMIENYRLKLTLLEAILSSLKQNNIENYEVEI